MAAVSKGFNELSSCFLAKYYTAVFGALDIERPPIVLP